ncbi:hypothetical protein GCM10023196_084310 [Actinoallomurus vinaceus]|uniref:Glyoxalase/fosfomycin resistance/dioxygenase domain-containing protein n=1 Tax=Actinoallomurus vinaceus TaxID=1080074 RepID=A0ABP8UNL9_9ACTN
MRRWRAAGAGRRRIRRGSRRSPSCCACRDVPLTDDAKVAQVRDLTAAGDLDVGALATDDCRATYEELKGVEFTEEPTERCYGVDAAFRDPFGNLWHLSQPKPVTAMPEPAPKSGDMKHAHWG